MLPVTLGDESLEQLVENYGLRMIIIDPIQEYLEHDVYKDTQDMTYPALYKLEKLAKESGGAVVLTTHSDGVGSRHGEVWRNEFAEKISSVFCLDYYRNGIFMKEGKIMNGSRTYILRHLF